MDTTNPGVQFAIQWYSLLALFAFTGVLFWFAERMSVQRRSALQWVLICLVGGLLVAGVEGVPQLIVDRSASLITPFCIIAAQLFALGGLSLSPPQEAEGKPVLAARVCGVLAGVATILGVLPYVVRALTYHYDLNWLVSELRTWS